MKSVYNEISQNKDWPISVYIQNNYLTLGNYTQRIATVTDIVTWCWHLKFCFIKAYSKSVLQDISLFFQTIFSFDKN